MAEITRPIEPFQLTQGFGENPKIYARFGLKGHNGWDFKTRLPDTPNGERPILASWFSSFYGTGKDPKGYGNWLEVTVQLKSLWKLTYAHCKSIEQFNEKSEGQTLAISDNTGFSTGPHLHLTCKRVQWNQSTLKFETLDYSNGYKGAVNPQEFFDELRKHKYDMTDEQKKIFSLLEEYRKVRKQGPEGSFEGFVNAVLGSDRDIENVKKDLQKCKNTVPVSPPDAPGGPSNNTGGTDEAKADAFLGLLGGFLRWLLNRR